LDDILDEAMPRINGKTSDDAFPPITQEDMLFLIKCGCIVNALKRICDFQSAPARNPLSSRDLSSHGRYADITPELTVYRYSEDKVIEYLQAKVSRLSKHAVAERSRTIIRNLAKDGLMDDGKEDLLERRCPVGQQGVGVPS
jgi:ribonuclease H2 subunit B